MNALLARFAMVIMVLVAASATAATATAAVEGNLSYTDLGSTIRIDGCALSTCPTAITIPATLTGKPVTSLAASAFSGKSTLTSVSFATPSNLTTIGRTAFESTGLTAVTIPASLTTMGEGAFVRTTALETATFAAPSSLTAIPTSAFEESGLTAVSIPDSVTAIGDTAFRRCPRLTRASIGRETTSIGAGAFALTPALTSVAFSPDGRLTTLDTMAFASSGLQSVDIPDSVTSMESWVFYQTSALTDVTIGRGLGEIPQLTFFESGIRSISFASPSAVTTINNQAFYGVANLETITIPSSVSVIGPDAFWRATGLRSVIFAWPSSVTTLGFKTFMDAANLASIDFFGNAPTVDAGAFSGTPSSLVIRYLAASNGWTTSLDGRAAVLAAPWTPATPTATPGDGSANVTTSVSYPSNAPAEITVIAAPGGQSCRIAGASGTCTITGLTNGTAYTFSAVAANATGTSNASNASASITPSGKAVVPTSAAGTLRVSKPRTSRQAMTTVVTIAGPGVIRQTTTRIASSKRSSNVVCSSVRRAKIAGRFTITCAFNSRIRAELRRQAIRVRVTTRFTPTNGKATVSSTTLTIPRSR